MSYGWAGNILRINLTTEKISREPTARYARDYIGGRGINARILYNEAKPGQGAFDPETPLLFGAGPLVGTGAPGGSRTAVASRSASQVPELYGISNFGGFWGPELKFAGYDNLVIKGRAKKPVYLFVDNENIELRDASGVWGKDTFETQTEIREDLDDPEVQVACIGQAGENLVRCATIQHEFWGAGKNGLGAVMGSKNLKAVAVRGTKGVKIADPDRFMELCGEARELIKESEGYEDWAKYGIARCTEKYMIKPNVFSFGPIGNYERQEWAGLENLRGQPFIDRYGIRGRGCFGCPGACMNYVVIPGVDRGGITCSPYLWSWRAMVPDLERVFETHTLCNRYGISSLFVGTASSWLMHMYDKGVITEKDTDGIPFERGSREALLGVVHKTALREGFGDILAEGLPKLAEKLGKEAEKHLITIRGSTGFNSEYRSKIGFSLASAVTVSTHWHAGPDIEMCAWEKEQEVMEKFYRIAQEKYGTSKAAIAYEYEGKARAVVYSEHTQGSDDMLGFCCFLSGRLEPSAVSVGDHLAGRMVRYDPHVIALFSAATGVDIDQEILFRAVDRVITLERAFIAREGQTRNEDTLPERFFTEPVPDGPNKGRKIDRTKFEKMKDEYYALRGWDIKTGIPTRKTLQELGLKDVVDELTKLGRLPARARTTQKKIEKHPK
jgi:aldehyde:ferredoxin oxidoreductase